MLWDWLQLFVVPLALAVVSVLFAQREKKRERFLATHQANKDREAAEDRDRESALNAYVDQVSSLLLERGLRSSNAGDEIRDVTRARTLMLLQRLDGKRKAALLGYLHGSGLIQTPNPVVNLTSANFNQADFTDAVLPGIDLSGIQCQQANFTRANFTGANFVGCVITALVMENTILR